MLELLSMKHRHLYIIIDANINRISEGLRTIEEYTRFISQNVSHTQALSEFRKTVNQLEPSLAAQLSIRDIKKDVRATDIPQKRENVKAVLKANFKRVQEALRVLEEYTGNEAYCRLRYDAYALEKDILLPLLKPLGLQGIYVISDMPEHLIDSMDNGASIIQLRDKYADKHEIFEKASYIAPIAKKRGVHFIINDFMDIAMLVDADGLHTGQDDLPIPSIRELLGEHKWIGRSTHTPEQGRIAQEQGADYVSVGPLWETPSKPGRQGIGFCYLSQASDILHIPYVAIGGITLENCDQVAPFRPPMVGVIRDYQRITDIRKRCIVDQSPNQSH